MQGENIDSVDYSEITIFVSNETCLIKTTSQTVSIYKSPTTSCISSNQNIDCVPPIKTTPTILPVEINVINQLLAYKASYDYCIEKFYC